MKYLAILFLVVLCVTQIAGRQICNEENSEFDTKASRGYTAKLQQFLDVELRGLMRNGDSSRGIPVLDPLEQFQSEFTLDNNVAKIKGKITDLYSENLSTYKVRVATVSILSRKATIGLTFPSIYAKGNYSVEGAAWQNVEVFGDGEFEATVRDLKVDAVIAVSVVGGVKVKSINLKIVLGELNFMATGIYHDDNFSDQLSQDISDKAPQFISVHQNQITKILSTYMIEAANKFLSKNRMSEVSEIFV